MNREYVVVTNNGRVYGTFAWKSDAETWAHRYLPATVGYRVVEVEYPAEDFAWQLVSLERP